MVVDTSIKITKSLRERLYFLKGPDKDYNSIIEELVEEREHRPQPASNETGNATTKETV